MVEVYLAKMLTSTDFKKLVVFYVAIFIDYLEIVIKSCNKKEFCSHLQCALEVYFECERGVLLRTGHGLVLNHR